MAAFLVLLDAAVLFAAAITVSFLARLLWRPILFPVLRVSARLANALDGFLVLRVAPAFGLGWVSGVGGRSSGIGRNVRQDLSVGLARLLRWSHLLVVFTLIACAGALLSLAPAIALLALGFLGVLAIIRRWLWDEDDRARDVPSPLRRIIGGEDLINEALFAGAFIFLLTPILLFRLDAAFGLFSRPPNPQAAIYALFTLGEFFKALPLVDYSEVYGVHNFSDVEPTSLLGRNATFGLRVVLDGVLIGGLFHLVSVLRRIAEGFDIRKLKERLESGDDQNVIGAIDALSERALRNQQNARRELVNVLVARDGDLQLRFQPAARFSAAFALHQFAERYGDTPVLLLVADTYRALVQVLPEGSPNWVRTHVLLAEVQTLRGSRMGGAQRDVLLETAKTFRALCERLQSGDERDLLADASFTLGNALWLLAEIERKRDSRNELEEAVRAFGVGLEIYSATHSPEKWAKAKLNLGAALVHLASQQGEGEQILHFEAAERAYRDALPLLRTINPADWAVAQMRLGLLLRRWSQATSGTKSEDLLVQSLDAFERALEEQTKADAPMAWANTKLNQGRALYTRGRQLEMSAQSIDAFGAALKAYEDALSGFEEARAPSQVVWVHEYVGKTHAELANRSTELATQCAHLDMAAQSLRRAVELFREMDQLDDAAEISALLNRVETAHKSNCTPSPSAT